MLRGQCALRLYPGGMWGAGGLGLILNEKIGWREYASVGMILLALFVTVFIIETISRAAPETAGIGGAAMNKRIKAAYEQRPPPLGL